MAKGKITSDDFLRLMDDEESSSQPAAFSPSSIESNNKKESLLNIKPLANREQTVSNASPKALAKREQTVSRPLAETGVFGLIGKEKKLLFFIYQKCESSGSLETPILTTEELLKNLDVSSVRLRNLIFRLQEQKKVITVTQVHFGRSGWRRFSISKEIFQLIRLGLSTKIALAEREQSVSNASPKALAYPLAEASYSSSTLNNINTTTIELPENLARLGISKNNLQKLVDENLCTSEVVQKSLEALSFDVEKGKSGNIAAILFGVLRSGREYISQKHAERLSKELEIELNRLKAFEDISQKLTEARLKTRYAEFLEKTPGYLNEIKKRHSGLINENSELLEKLAFEEFKTRYNHESENQNQRDFVP